MNKEPRLRFTDEERADPTLEKPIRKADKAAAKADKAQSKIPKKQVRQKTVDPETGKVTTKLVLEDKKKPPSKLSHAVRDTPANAALGKVHKEIRETEQDNVGVESAHKSEEAAETGVRLAREGYRSHKLKPYRKAAQAEQKLEKAKSQVGNVGGQPYWSWYGFNSRVEWCACFVSWCYGQMGLSEPRFAACQSQGIPWFQSHGQWGGRDYANIAPGDAIFFDWDLDGSADHVGLVVGTDGSRVYTVEGNSGDACKIKSYSLSYECIKGYGLMNW